MNNIRVYVISCCETDFDFRSAESRGDLEAIKDEAERIGSVYSLRGFQEAINDDSLFLSESFVLFANKNCCEKGY